MASLFHFSYSNFEELSLQKNEIKRQLIEYCKLDTMAMVIIAHHWGLK